MNSESRSTFFNSEIWIRY